MGLQHIDQCARAHYLQCCTYNTHTYYTYCRHQLSKTFSAEKNGNFWGTWDICANFFVFVPTLSLQKLMRYCLAFPIKPCQVAARAVMQAGHQCVATPATATHMNFGSPFNQLSNFHCFQPNHFKYKQTGSDSKSPNLLVLL